LGSAAENEPNAKPSYLLDAVLASGGVAAVCLLGVLGRFSFKVLKNRRYEKLDGSTMELRATPSRLSQDEIQDEMCYQNFKITELNVSQVYF